MDASRRVLTPGAVAIDGATIAAVGSPADIAAGYSGEILDTTGDIVLPGLVNTHGHAPMVRGRTLQAYIAAGVASDHESGSAAEAAEKLRSGMQVLIREGSTAKNLDALLPIVNERTARFCSLATDDKQPDDLQKDSCRGAELPKRSTYAARHETRGVVASR